MTMKVLVSAVLLLALAVSGQVLPNTAVLDPDGVFVMNWDYDATSVTIETIVRTTGYIGWGISPDGTVYGADVIMGWIKDGVTTFYDRWSTAPAEPAIDAIQNYELLSSSDNATHTTLRFRRLIDTGDAQQDLVIESGPIILVYCWFDQDPDGPTGLPYHGPNRGGATITLIPF